MRQANKQMVLRPQDLVVVLKVALLRGRNFTYATLGADLALAPSEVHACISRVLLARLVTQNEDAGISPIYAAIREFVVHGARYAFPPISGPNTRGMPTAYGAPIFRNKFQPTDAPVWPMIEGQARGPALYPLYPTVPIAAAKDPSLYDMLALVDAVRAGGARERDLATTIIAERLV